MTKKRGIEFKLKKKKQQTNEYATATTRISLNFVGCIKIDFTTTTLSTDYAIVQFATAIVDILFGRLKSKASLFGFITASGTVLFPPYK